MPKTVALVSCVKTKRPVAMPASELYCSDFFKKMAAYAKKNADNWFILSAKYGLLRPDTVIQPYDLCLRDLPKGQRLTWSRQVISDLKQELAPGDRLIILASVPYREFLITPLQEMGCEVQVPMAGISQFKQLQWLKNHLA